MKLHFCFKFWVSCAFCLPPHHPTILQRMELSQFPQWPWNSAWISEISVHHWGLKGPLAANLGSPHGLRGFQEAQIDSVNGWGFATWLWTLQDLDITSTAVGTKINKLYRLVQSCSWSISMSKLQSFPFQAARDRLCAIKALCQCVVSWYVTRCANWQNGTVAKALNLRKMLTFHRVAVQINAISLMYIYIYICI